MEHQETIKDPQAAGLVRSAADGDWRSWARLVDHYRDLVAATREATTADDEIPREVPGQETRTSETLRAAERARTAGNARSSRLWRWQQLLELLSAYPPGQQPPQQGR